MQQDIEVIQGLDSCVNLEYLWLNENRIKRIEGLHNCLRLSEIYLYAPVPFLSTTTPSPPPPPPHFLLLLFLHAKTLIPIHLELPFLLSPQKQKKKKTNQLHLSGKCQIFQQDCQDRKFGQAIEPPSSLAVRQPNNGDRKFGIPFEPESFVACKEPNHEDRGSSIKQH